MNFFKDRPTLRSKLLGIRYFSLRGVLNKDVGVDCWEARQKCPMSELIRWRLANWILPDKWYLR